MDQVRRAAPRPGHVQRVGQLARLAWQVQQSGHVPRRSIPRQSRTGRRRAPPRPSAGDSTVAAGSAGGRGSRATRVPVRPTRSSARCALHGRRTAPGPTRTLRWSPLTGHAPRAGSAGRRRSRRARPAGSLEAGPRPSRWPITRRPGERDERRQPGLVPRDRRRRRRFAGEHGRKLEQTLVLGHQLADLRHRSAVVADLLLDVEMRVGVRGDLRQVRDAPAPGGRVPVATAAPRSAPRCGRRCRHPPRRTPAWACRRRRPARS